MLLTNYIRTFLIRKDNDWQDTSLLCAKFYEWRINQMVLNSLLYIQDLQVKYINVYKDLIRKLDIYINAIHIFPLVIYQLT